MSIEVLVYSPLMEDESENVTGWEKDTVRLCMNCKSRIHKQIRGAAKGLGKITLSHSDLEDIYMELLMYLYKSDDYNLNKALERSKTDQIVTLDGYINTCIKYCVARHCTTSYKEEKIVLHDNGSTDDDGKEFSLLNNIPDTKSLDDMDTVMYDLENLCKTFEGQRYMGQDTDIYQVWFVKLLTEGMPQEIYLKILDILDVSKKELSSIRNSDTDGLMASFAKATHICGTEKAKEIMRKYVYGAKQIEDAVLALT